MPKCPLRYWSTFCSNCASPRVRYLVSFLMVLFCLGAVYSGGALMFLRQGSRYVCTEAIPIIVPSVILSGVPRRLGVFCAVVVGW